MAGELNPAAVAALESSFWDKKYSGADCFYGEAPNVHIRDAALKYLPQPSVVVELASGEGRNVAFLAQVGHTVHAVDFSAEGLRKTVQLAAKHGAAAAGRVVTHESDIMVWHPPGGPASVDAVVMSFCHVVDGLKQQLLDNVVGMLKPGGYLLLEVFHPDQTAKGYRPVSGGPADPSMMTTLAQLRTLLAANAGREVEGAEVEYELDEGPGHRGVGAVTRAVWQKEPQQQQQQ